MIKTLVKTLQKALSSFFHIKFSQFREVKFTEKNCLEQISNEMSSPVYDPRPFSSGHFLPALLSLPPRPIRAHIKFTLAPISNIHLTNIQIHFCFAWCVFFSPGEKTKQWKQ